MSARPVTGIAGLACLAVGVATSSLLGTSYAAPRVVLPTHVNSCWSNDNGAPVVDSLALSTHAVNVTAASATVNITVDAHDTGGPGHASGIARVKVEAFQFWTNSSDAGRPDAAAGIPLHLVGKEWVGTYTIPQDSHAMDVRFEVSVDALKGPDSDPLQPQTTDTVEVTSGNPDTTPPSLNGLSLSPDHVAVSHTGKDVHVTAQVTDDDTGLAGAKIFAQGQRPSPGIPLKPTGTAGEVGATIHVSRWVGAAALPLYVDLTDGAGNKDEVTPQELADLGLPSQISIAGSPKDPADPRLVSVGGTPSPVDVREDHAHWTIRLRARDQGSGVSSVLVSSVNPTDTPVWTGEIGLHLVTGNRRDGVWGARIPIRRCAPGEPAGSTNGVFVSLRDRTGRLTLVQAKGPRLRGPDHAPPITTGDAGSQRFGIDFSEPMHGISRGATEVVSLGHTPRVVHGSWSCANERGASVSCLTGTVRHASFSYGPGHPADFVDLEPDGHLDVLDLNGNPVPHGGIVSLDEG